MFRNREGKVRSGWKIALVLGAIFVLVFILSMILGVVIVFQAAQMADTQEMTFDAAYDALFDQWELPLSVIQDVLLIAVSLFAWRVLSKRKLADMGLGGIKTNWKALAAGLLMGIVSMTLTFLAILATGSGYVESWSPRFSWEALTFLIVFILVGFAEEILSRGYFMSVLRQTKSRSAILIVSSALFSLMHIFNDAFNLIPFINIALAGLLFGYMFIKSGSIWMPIGFHITWNYVQGNVFGFHVSGLEVQGLITTQYAQENIINGGAFGPEGGVAVTVLLLLSFLFVRWYYRKSRFDFLSMDGEVAADGDGQAVTLA